MGSGLTLGRLEGSGQFGRRAATGLAALSLLVLVGGGAANKAWAQAAAPAQPAAARQAAIPQAGQTDASRSASYRVDSLHPLYWLERWHHAVAQHPYVGTVTVGQAQGRPRSARVWHGVRAGQQIDRIDMLHAGRPYRTLVRSGQDVVVWDAEAAPPRPGQPGWHKDMGRGAGAEPGAAQRKGPRHHAAPGMPQVGAPFSPAGHMDAAQLRQAAQYYRVVLLGQQQVARHAADAIGFLPVDDLRAPYRFWTEQQTGLLLKWQMLQLRGRDAAAWQQAQVLREMAFEEVQVPAPVDFAMLHSLLRRPPAQPKRQGRGQAALGQQRLQPSRQPASSLQAQGWAWREPLPGYVVQSCYRRKLAVVAAGPQRSSGAPDGTGRPASAPAGAAHDARLQQPVLHCMVTDGLSRFSLFIGPRELMPAQPPQVVHDAHTPSRSGGVRMARRAYGNSHTITAVGAVPQAALQQAVDALYRP